MTERIAIYVDGANAYFAQKEALGWWIDWPRFLDAMREGKDIVSARWYQSYRSNPEPEQERFLHHLTIIGFAVRKKVCKQIYDRTTGSSSLKGSLDLELAIDALTEADQFDTAILVTGDSDFVPLIEALHARGKRVIVAATPQNVAVELRQQVGVNFIDLQDLREKIESDKRPPESRERVVISERPRTAAAVGSGGNGNVKPAAEAEEDYEDEYDDEYDDEEYDEYDDDGYDDGDYDEEPPNPEDVELPLEGEIVRCRVQTVKKYGVFLDLHKHAKTLLHVKDMNRGFVPDAGEYYTVGEEIPVQIVSIDRTKQPPEVRVQVVTPEMEY